MTEDDINRIRRKAAIDGEIRIISMVSEGLYDGATATSNVLPHEDPNVLPRQIIEESTRRIRLLNSGEARATIVHHTEGD